MPTIEQVAIFQDHLNPSGPKHHKPRKQQALSCPSCGELVGEQDKFCLSCGHSISKLCASGHWNPIHAMYCVECGTDLKVTSAVDRLSNSNDRDTEIDILARNGVEITDDNGIIRLFSITHEELEKGIEDCPECNNPLKVAGPGSRLLNSVPLLPNNPEDHTGSLTVCNKCGEVSFAGTYYEGD